MCGGGSRTIVGDVTVVVTVDVVPRKQEHALETREAGNEVTPVGKRSSSSVRPSGYTERVMVEVDVTVLNHEDGMLESGLQIWRKKGHRLLTLALASLQRRQQSPY